MKKLPFFLGIISILFFNSAKAQFKWDVLNDSVTLTPTNIIADGQINVMKVNGEGYAQVNGNITLAFNEKNILFNDGNNLFKLSSHDLAGINLTGYGYFNGNTVFTSDFRDTIIHDYRQILYPTLNLNEITFSLSKRTQFGYNDKGIFIIDQKRLVGKICSVDPSSIVILSQEGNLLTLKDGDFNYLEIGSFKAFYCKNLYDYIYLDYVRNLSQTIENFKTMVMQKSIESLIDIFGPFDQIFNITSDKKLITWKKNSLTYNVNLTTHSISNNLNTNPFSVKVYSSYDFLYSNISPIFRYGNSYINSDYSSFGFPTTTSSLTSQSGYITSKDEGFIFSIIQDANNKIVQVYQKNIFADAPYGSPFRFIAY